MEYSVLTCCQAVVINLTQLHTVQAVNVNSHGANEELTNPPLFVVCSFSLFGSPAHPSDDVVLAMTRIIAIDYYCYYSTIITTLLLLLSLLSYSTITTRTMGIVQ